MHVVRWLSKSGLIITSLLMIIIAGCEPFAPQEQQAPVVVITATATEAPPPTATPLFSNTLPTQPPPTPTPTLPAITAEPTLVPCTETTGRVIENTFTSTISGGEVPYRVYVPPCFFQTLRRYPYLILLHGSGFDYTQWTNDIGIQDTLNNRITDALNPLPPMVVIMPEGGSLEELNYFEVGQSFENIIIDELMPHIEQQFCVIQAREGRAIGGISRGGFWATSIAFRHPELFSALGAHSPYYDETSSPPTHNPLFLAENIDGNTDLRIYLDHAREDIAAANVLALSSTLRSNNVFHQYEIAPTGGHDNEYWQAHTVDYLEFYARDWWTDPNDLPSCFE